MDVGQLLEKVKDYADLAVHFDSQGFKEAALFYYTETALLIDSAFENVSGAPDVESLKAKAADYRKRASDIQKSLLSVQSAPEKHETDLERAYFLLTQGLDCDEDGQIEEAVELYTEAVELCIKAKNASKEETTKKKLSKVAVQALDRAEKLKGIDRTPKQDLKPAFDLLHVGDEVKDVRQKASAGSGLSNEEKKVLATTSVINGREYLPFMAGDLKEKFAFPVPFTDKHGKLSLATKQSSKLVKWARPDEFISQPSVIQHVDCYCVKQTVVSDCSFVASIAIR